MQSVLYNCQCNWDASGALLSSSVFGEFYTAAPGCFIVQFIVCGRVKCKENGGKDVSDNFGE